MTQCSVKATLISLFLIIFMQAGGPLLAQKVPTTFRYPEAPETIRMERELSSKSLSGVVVDPSGAASSKVLVERVRTGWGKRIGGVLTDSKGRFAFTEIGPGTYFLRISKPGYNTILLKVRVSAKSKSTLRLALTPSV